MLDKKCDFNMRLTSLFIALLSFCLSAFIMANVYFEDGDLPDKEQLKSVSGEVESVWFTGKRSNTTRFKLKNHPLFFVYFSIAGNFGDVRSVVKTGAKVTILYSENEGHSSTFDSDVYYTVYELKLTDAKVIAAYEKIKESFSQNAKVGGILSVLFFIMGLYSTVKFIRQINRVRLH